MRIYIHKASGNRYTLVAKSKGGYMLRSLLGPTLFVPTEAFARDYYPTDRETF